MTTTSHIELVTDEAIASRPQLLAACREVTDEFIRLYESGPPTRGVGTATVSWRLTRPDAPDVVNVDVSELEDGKFRRGLSRVVPAGQLIDPVAGGIWATRLWRYLLQARSDENMQRIERALQELERDGADG